MATVFVHAATVKDMLPAHGNKVWMIGLRLVTLLVVGEKKYKPFPVFLRRSNNRDGVWCIFQKIVVFRLVPQNNFLCLLTDFNHSIAEP